MQDEFVNDTEWMYWATQERMALDIFLLRSGWDSNFTTQSFTVTGAENGVFQLAAKALAVVSIHESTSQGVRLLSHNNAADFLRQIPGSSLNRGHATEFRVRTAGDDLILNLFPEPLVGETYLVTYIPAPDMLVLSTPGTGQATDVTYPLGWEERIVLGMARRALIKEESETRKVEELIKELESQIEEVTFARVMSDVPTIRNVDRDRRGWTERLLFPLWQQWAWL